MSTAPQAPTGTAPADHAEDGAGQKADLARTGERIEALLDAASTGSGVARERAEELVRLVVDLYGAGLERILDILYETDRLDEALLADLAADELVSSLLVVHGLHPYDVNTRVEQALERVRPYLGSHGGDVSLVGVTDEGVVTLQMLGSCDGCASSAVTLSLAVEDAIRAAAPEVASIEVEETPKTAPVISIDSLSVRTRAVAGSGGGARWSAVPELVDLSSGEVRGAVVGGVAVAACRVGDQSFAFRDSCPRCQAGLVDGSLERQLGGSAAVLRCAGCGGHYDVRRAGASLDLDGGHLDPLPLLVRDGVVEIAVPDVVPS